MLGIVDASTNENKEWIKSARTRLAEDPEFCEFFRKVKPLKPWEQLKVDETLRLLGDQGHQALRADVKVPEGKTADEVLDELRLEHAEVAANLAYASRRFQITRETMGYVRCAACGSGSVTSGLFHPRVKDSDKLHWPSEHPRVWLYRETGPRQRLLKLDRRFGDANPRAVPLPRWCGVQFLFLTV